MNNGSDKADHARKQIALEWKQRRKQITLALRKMNRQDLIDKLFGYSREPQNTRGYKKKGMR